MHHLNREDPRTAWRARTRRMSAVLLLLLGAAVLAGCATRANKFKEFAKAGTRYADLQNEVILQAAAAAIDNDSLVLSGGRENLESLEKRQAAITKNNNLIERRLELLEKVRQHGTLLRAYFDALGRLAETDAPRETAEAARRIGGAIETLDPGIKEAEVGGVKVAGLMGRAVDLAVSLEVSGALEGELKERASTIGREMDLQKAAMRAIAGQAKTDRKARINQIQFLNVDSPYADSDGPLPADWMERRREVFMARFSSNSFDAAVQAAERLHGSFVALVEGRLEESDMPALLDEMDRHLAEIIKLRTAARKE